MTYMALLGIADPVVALAILPLALPFGLILEAEQDSVSMHIIILKLSNVLVTTYEELRAFSLHFAISEFTLVAGLIRPHHDALAVHDVVGELAFVDLTGVGEVVLADAVELPIDELTLVVPSFVLKSSPS